MNLLKIPRYISSTVVLIMICYATLFPHPFGDMQPPRIANIDKLVHFIMFGVLAVAIGIDAFSRKMPINHIVLRLSVAAILSIMFGGLIEILQDMMHIGRTADIYDFLFDILGAVVAYVVCVIVMIKNKNRT